MRMIHLARAALLATLAAAPAGAQDYYLRAKEPPPRMRSELSGGIYIVKDAAPKELFLVRDAVLRELRALAPDPECAPPDSTGRRTCTDTINVGFGYFSTTDARPMGLRIRLLPPGWRLSSLQAAPILALSFPQIGSPRGEEVAAAVYRGLRAAGVRMHVDPLTGSRRRFSDLETAKSRFIPVDNIGR